MNSGRIRVLVVDDSALLRTAVTNLLSRFPDIEVVGNAPDPYAARDLIEQLNPDVLTLDIEMPRMDGVTFLKLIMRHRPMPVIIMSSQTRAGSEKALEALQAGAVEVLCKPAGPFTATEDALQLAISIRAAARARLMPSQPIQARCAAKKPALASGAEDARQIILIGASTGGTEALKVILASLPSDLPGICVVQHIPAYFSGAFARRLNDYSALEVREARHGDVLNRGTALIAPGDRHMILKWQGGRYRVELNDGPKLHFQRPSVDILFNSAVECGAGPHAVAALLTGMGTDGASGLLMLRSTGAQTIAQDEESSIVFGMPREAIQLGAAQHVLPLDRIAGRIERLSNPTRTAAPLADNPVAV